MALDDGSDRGIRAHGARVFIAAVDIHLVLDDERSRAQALRILADLPLERAWQMLVKPWRAKRTLPQNARLHLLFRLLSNATGNDVGAVKLHYKEKFLTPTFITFKQQSVAVYPRTSKMDKKELNEFMEKCEADLATEWGLWLD